MMNKYVLDRSMGMTFIFILVLLATPRLQILYFISEAVFLYYFHYFLRVRMGIEGAQGEEGC